MNAGTVERSHLTAAGLAELLGEVLTHTTDKVELTRGLVALVHVYPASPVLRENQQIAERLTDEWGLSVDDVVGELDSVTRIALGFSRRRP